PEQAPPGRPLQRAARGFFELSIYAVLKLQTSTQGRCHRALSWRAMLSISRQSRHRGALSSTTIHAALPTTMQRMERPRNATSLPENSGGLLFRPLEQFLERTFPKLSCRLPSQCQQPCLSLSNG